MTPQRRRNIRRRGHHTEAFTLVEVLLSLAILAMLMAAIGSAVYASLDSYEQNEHIASATQATRAVLDRISRDIRTAAAVSAGSTQITIITPAGSEAQQIDYDWDSGDGVLYYRRKVDGSTTSYPLLGDGDVTISSFSVTYETGLDWEGISCTKSVTVLLDIAIDGKTFTMTGSASPRRNQLY